MGKKRTVNRVKGSPERARLERHQKQLRELPWLDDGEGGASVPWEVRAAGKAFVAMATARAKR
jgi:hypothetical protein